jgi:SOS-response transcriptional repressor LexA
MSKLGDTIRQIRKSQSKTLAEIADQVEGYDAGNLSRFERGEQDISPSKLESIARALGLTVADIYNSAQNNVVNQVRPFYGHNPLNQVPLISWVQAGMFVECIDDLGECEMIATDLKIKAHTFALRVQGDSMEPILNEGMIVIVEPDMQALHGHFVVAKNGDNEATLKQLVQDGGDWFLKPLNTRYPVKPLGDSHIVGVVRQSITKFV